MARMGSDEEFQAEPQLVMNDPISTLLAAHPKCRVTISSGSTRRRPQQGDRRFTKKYGWLIRRVQTHCGMTCVRRGRPIYEWARESELDQADLASLRRIGAWRGGLNPYVIPTVV